MGCPNPILGQTIKGKRPNIGIRSHRCRSIGHWFSPIPLKVGRDIIRTKWNGIGNGSQFFIGPINKGHQKYLAAQITRHKSKSVNVVFRCTNTLNFQFKCCRPADKVFLLIITLIFPINKSCLNQNLTSQFQHLFVFPMTEYDQKILNFCIKIGTRRNSRSFNNAEEHLLSERWRNVHCKCTISKWSF